MATFIGDWKYRGEGNSSLVVANTADSTVYRLYKVNAEKPKSSVESVKMELERQISFTQNVMSPLIGQSYLVPSKLVKLSEEFLHEVKHYTDDIRPGYRMSKSVDVSCLFAVQMPDLCSLPLIYNTANSVDEQSTFAIEIKPKWGYMPTLGAEGDMRGHVCRFCMHQFLKVKEGKWPSRSGYCPIDLFSGCTERMSFALQQLFETPQNNLRLFKNGSVIWSSEVKSDIDSELSTVMCCCSQQDLSSSLTSLCTEDGDCFLHPLSSSPKLSYGYDEVAVSYGEWIAASLNNCHQLPEHCVLAQIRRTQMLNDLSIEHIMPSYDHLNKCFDDNPRLRELSGIDGPFTADWLKNSDGLAGYSDSTKDALLRVKEFLVSRSAKDCSLFISVRPVSSRCHCSSHSVDESQRTKIDRDLLKNSVGTEQSQSWDLATVAQPDRHFVIVDSVGQHFICCVSVIDLDPKRFDKIPFYLAEDRAVVDCYSKLASS